VGILDMLTQLRLFTVFDASERLRRVLRRGVADRGVAEGVVVAEGAEGLVHLSSI
jgi:hypothetical protein